MKAQLVIAPPAASERSWMSQKEYQAFNRRRAMRCWLQPYLRSRLHPREFRPLLAYLFTEMKCNLDCHYCWAHHNRRRACPRRWLCAASTGSGTRAVACSP